MAVQHATPTAPYEIQVQKPLRRPSASSVQGDFSLRVRQAQAQVHALSELEERVAALNDALAQPSRTEAESYQVPHYPEIELRNIYKDLLSFPDPEPESSVTRTHVDLIKEPYLDVSRVLAERILMFETAVRAPTTGTGLSTRLHARMASIPSNLSYKQSHHDTQQELLIQEGEYPLRTLINRLRVVIDALCSTWPRTGADDSSLPPIPLGLLSNTEWRTLSQVCVDADDAPGSEAVLDLMKRSGLPPSDEQYDAILNWYATRGQVDDADSFMSRLCIDFPRERQRDLLVKARVNANRLDDACGLIHTLETRTIPAPMQSYTRVIQALLSQRGPGAEQQKAQAWDMFSHMRYVAHATVDHFLYSVMIRACAESADPEPERALDLFTEMMVEKKIAPTTHAYNAVILTCARSKNFVLEAFRLAREMLNSHRDAHGEIPARLRPDKNTFCALLEAAKRMGDLPRARWILAQMTESAYEGRESEQPVFIDEKVMIHVFHAYAAYRPPFHRDAVTFVSEGESVSQTTSEKQGRDASQGQEIGTADIRRPRGAPQSRQEVVKEASTLWKRILEDRQNIGRYVGDDPSEPPTTFGRVSLTTSLLNAYMAVHYAHSSPTASYKVYSDLFELLGVPRDAFTCVFALEAYAQGKRAAEPELRLRLSFARDVWKSWQDLETSGVVQMSDDSADPKVDARLVERAWSAMIKILALNGHLDEANDLLHRFVERYPPSLVKQPSPFNPKRSTRTVLYAERPLVRLIERVAVPEDRITPFLTFMDLSLLHHRAVAAKRTALINHIKWVAKVYEGALRRRRDATLRAS